MYTYYVAGIPITDELFHDDLEACTFGRKDQNELMHYGIKGQQWGKRRFQEEDGSLTAAGRQRYDVGSPTSFEENVGSYMKREPNLNTNDRSSSSFIADTRKRNDGYLGTRLAKIDGRWSNASKFNDGRGGLSGSSYQELSRRNQAPDSRFIADTRKRNDGLLGTREAKIQGSFDDAKAAGIANSTDLGRGVVDSIFGNSNINKKGYQQNPSNPKQVPETQNESKPGILGRLGNAANAVGNWASDRANDVAGAATRAYEGARDAGDKVVDWAADRANDVAGAATRAYEGAKNLGYEVQSLANTPEARSVAGAANSAIDWASDRANDVAGAATRAYEGARDWVGGIFGGGRSESKEPESNNSQPQAPATQNESKPGILGRLGNAANAVGNWARDRGEDISGAATRAYEGARDWVGDRAQDVGKAANAAREYIKNGGERVTYPGYWDPDRQAQHVGEKPDGVSDEYWQEYTLNGGTRDSWDAARGIQSQGNAQRQAPATPSGKPDGVSDEYWQEYTANGGTPESYEEEQRARRAQQIVQPNIPSGNVLNGGTSQTSRGRSVIDRIFGSGGNNVPEKIQEIEKNTGHPESLERRRRSRYTRENNLRFTNVRDGARRIYEKNPEENWVRNRQFKYNKSRNN